MNIHDLYEYGTEIDLLDLRGRFAFRTESSASFDLIGRGQDGELLIGWVDVHHPCDGFIRAKVRVIVPVEHHKFEWMRDFIQRLFTALGIPPDETFEADFIGSDHQIRYESAVDRNGGTDRIY